MKPEQALQHNWIRGSPSDHVNPSVLYRLMMFKKPNAFQKEILLVLSTLLNGKELKEIRETFTAIDVDHSGGISLDELCKAYKDTQGKIEVEQNEVDNIMDKVDFDNNGEI